MVDPKSLLGMRKQFPGLILVGNIDIYLVLEVYQQYVKEEGLLGLIVCASYHYQQHWQCFNGISGC